MNLIPQWAQLWKLYSVQIAAVLVALNAAATYWPALQGVVSPGVFSTVNAILGAAVILGRIIKQEPAAQ